MAEKKAIIRQGQLAAVDEKDLRSGDVEISIGDRTKEVGHTVSNVEAGPVRKIIARGKVSGSVGGEPIYSWIAFADGRTAEFHRIAKMNELNIVDVSQCREGEFLLQPGLIYRPCAKTAEMAKKINDIQRKKRLKDMGLIIPQGAI